VKLLLFPGSGSSSSHPSLVAIERAVAPMACVRADFPYRLAGRRAPDRPPVLLQAVRDAAKPLRRSKLVLGGRSMGGRICSLAVGDAEDPLPAQGLVLICYPLHPPGKPEKSRTEHLPNLKVPCLFLSGTKDAFGSVDELEAATAAIPGSVTHVWLDGGNHGLRRRDDEVAAIVRDWVLSL
jgi:uncharacterized protein